MLDLTNLTKRYYTLKLIDAQGNQQKLSVKPAKLKIITKMTDAIKDIDSENPDLDPIVEILAKMLSSNKEGVTITNLSTTDPIVILKHFSDNPDLVIK